MMKNIRNDFKLRLPALNENVDVCIKSISAFLDTYHPTTTELGDIRVSVHEAFTNCVQHAYEDLPEGKYGYVYISVRYYDSREVSVVISDNGCGFKPETRTTPCSGLMIMNEFMDSVTTKSKIGKGTTILMRKELASEL